MSLASKIFRPDGELALGIRLLPPRWYQSWLWAVVTPDENILIACTAHANKAVDVETLLHPAQIQHLGGAQRCALRIA
eukprot:CAMPEP_0180778708 /NCGR_PEP_ID=MMETSP1038_2-20121128/45974_1 /TAXON_ID=632150 /ORGANISM="Azadinium spinosum, Strain 3D9" /LENGTH=77 /DNA_ID=CAMNT_0022813907 /DNA_START=1038 /DNA_END=1271 /DNA_ORIENTATION=-